MLFYIKIKIKDSTRSKLIVNWHEWLDKESGNMADGGRKWEAAGDGEREGE